MQDHNNNLIKNTDNEIIGRGIYNIQNAYLQRNEQSFGTIYRVNNILKANIIKDEDLYHIYKDQYNKYHYKTFNNTHTQIINFNNKEITKPSEDFIVNARKEYAIYNSYLNPTILINISKLLLYKYNIYSFITVGKMQPTINITEKLKMIKTHIIYKQYWILFLQNKIKTHPNWNITLQINSLNITIIDWDQNYNMHKEKIENLINKDTIISYSPKKHVKVIFANSKQHIISTNSKIEILKNKWVNIYGIYGKNGYYKLIINNNEKLIDIEKNIFTQTKNINIKHIDEKNHKNEYILNRTPNNVKIQDMQEMHTMFLLYIKQELETVKSKIHTIKHQYINEENRQYKININITCGAHYKNNRQAYCYFEYINKRINFTLKCSGSNCQIKYYKIKEQILLICFKKHTL